MLKKFLVTTALVSLAAAPAIADTPGKDWRFGDGATPERWSTIKSDYVLCDAGLSQSPIDLGTPNARGTIELTTNLGRAAGTMALGDQKVQVDFAPGQGLGMNSGGMAFNLLQVHFHTPSQHAINGKRFPLVAHFGHATEEGKLGVLGVMFEEGRANSGLATILEAHAKGNGSELAVDLSSMTERQPRVYHYMGSLTTPPCSEGVNWHVVAKPVSASAQQIAALPAALGPSARSLQPQGGRLVVAPAE